MSCSEYCSGVKVNTFQLFSELDRVCLINNLNLSSFVYPGLDFLCASWWVSLKKQRTLTLPVHLVHAPRFLWSPSYLLLLLCLYDFSYFVVYVCFPCLVCVPGLHSFDYRYSLGSLEYSWKTIEVTLMYDEIKWKCGKKYFPIQIQLNYCDLLDYFLNPRYNSRFFYH